MYISEYNMVYGIFFWICFGGIQLIEGSLEVKLPTIWTDGTAEVGRVREEKSRRDKIREEKESEERVRRKKMQVRER